MYIHYIIIIGRVYMHVDESFRRIQEGLTCNLKSLSTSTFVECYYKKPFITSFTNDTPDKEGSLMPRKMKKKRHEMANTDFLSLLVTILIDLFKAYKYRTTDSIQLLATKFI